MTAAATAVLVARWVILRCRWESQWKPGASRAHIGQTSCALCGPMCCTFDFSRLAKCGTQKCLMLSTCLQLCVQPIDCLTSSFMLVPSRFVPQGPRTAGSKTYLQTHIHIKANIFWQARALFGTGKGRRKVSHPMYRHGESVPLETPV